MSDVQRIETALSRSEFVTAVGWVFLALSAMGTLMGLFQSFMFAFILPGTDMIRRAAADPELAQLPPLVRFPVLHPQRWLLLVVLASAITLATSIGLLRRRRWARRLMIGILTLGVGSFVAGLGLAWIRFSSISFADDVSGPQSRFFLVMRLFMAILTLGLSALFLWLIRRLLSEPIREEFCRCA